MRLLFALLIVLCIVEASHSQAPKLIAQPSARLLTDEDGLPSMEVYHLYQDSKGYVWIGTADGICRYDGITFQKYTAENLTGRALTGITEDLQGRIWCHNFTGQILSVHQGRLQVANDWTQHISFGFPFIFIDRTNTLWAGSDKGMFQYNRSASAWEKKIFLAGEDSLNLPLDIRMDSKGWYWYINVHSQVFRSRDMTNWSKVLVCDSAGAELKTDEYLTYPFLTVLGNKAMLFGRNYKSVFTLEGNVFKKNPRLEKQLGKTVVFTGANECLGKYFCLNTYSGFFLLDTHYQLVKAHPYLHDKAISRVLTDREGNWWVATLGSGISIIPSLDILQLTPDENIGHRTMKIVRGPEGTVLAAMQNGLIYQMDAHTTQVTFKYQVPITKNVAAVHYWKDADRILTGSDNILQFKPGESNPEILLREGCIKSLSAGPGGSLVFVSCFKAALLSKKDQYLPEWKLAKPEKGQQAQRLLRTNRCRTTVYDAKKNRLWVAYQDQVMWYTTQDSGILYTKEGKPLFANALAVHSDTLWVGSVSDGLYAFLGNKEIAHYTRSNLLHTDAITSLAVQPGVVWVGTYEGVLKLNLASQNSDLFNKSDGLPSNEINDLLLYDEKVWMATGKGIAVMPSSTKAQNPFRPVIYLSKLFVNEVEQVIEPNFSLPYHANNLMFQLSGLSYRSRGTFTFKYRLMGLDTAWQVAQATDNLARFISLPPGKYTFEALTMNEDGLESLKKEQLSFEIQKPFWQTWWFYTLSGLSLIGMVSVFFQNRIKTIEQQNIEALAKAALKSEKEQVEQQLKISTLTAIKAQMNPHFIFNALNAIQNFFITDDKETANEYLGKFADLMRRILDMSNKELIELQEELEALKLYLELEQLRFGNTFNYTIHTQLTDSPETLRLPTMLVQPYVENAIKHGLLHKKTDRQLELSFIQEGSRLKVKIEDNGVGRIRAASINMERKKYTSFSTKANQKRLDLLNNELGGSLNVEIIDKYDMHNQPAGTVVWLNIPVTTNN